MGGLRPGALSALVGCLAAGVLGYLALRRWAVWRWLAAVAALPLVLVGLLGHLETGSVLLVVLVGAALALALWWAAPPALTGLGVVVLLVAGVVAHRAAGDGAWVLGPVPWSLLLALGVAPALLAAAGVARADRSGTALACGLAVLLPAIALAATHRDGAVALLWWPVAGALGVTAMLRGRRGSTTARPQVDEVDRAGLRDFAADLRTDRPGGGLAPVVIVIAAYNEAEGLPTVLEALPHQVCGLPADVVVVDDGSLDGTADEARATGRARVVACAVNRGQGAALRLGYRVARDHGASYVVTTDADGQYDVADLPTVLSPVLDGRADFVTGSRRLGTLHATDAVRRAGTRVFAALASVLLGRRLTDTSFGLRAMRAEVTEVVTLNQPQYQASELLVGVVSHGFRLLEVPATMHVRNQGASKKGGNLSYGSRYARVMLGTWLREGAPAPLTEVAPALAGPGRGVGRVPA